MTSEDQFVQATCPLDRQLDTACFPVDGIKTEISKESMLGAHQLKNINKDMAQKKKLLAYLIECRSAEEKFEAITLPSELPGLD